MASTTQPPEDKKIAKIVIDRDLCIGAASCVALAGGVFQLDDQNKAVVVNPTGADDETIMLAAKSCPVFAIFLYNRKGEQLYPEDRESVGGQTL